MQSEKNDFNEDARVENEVTTKVLGAMKNPVTK